MVTQIRIRLELRMVQVTVRTTVQRRRTEAKLTTTFYGLILPKRGDAYILAT